MEPPLPRIILIRLLLVAVPFVAWFAWSAWARRTGRAMGSTPYAWLLAAGAVLVGLSLAATVVFHPDNRREHYVPGEVRADGSVSKGYFTPSPASPKTFPR
jgi:hypothetical protein